MGQLLYLPEQPFQRRLMRPDEGISHAFGKLDKTWTATAVRFVGKNNRVKETFVRLILMYGGSTTS